MKKQFWAAGHFGPCGLAAGSWRNFRRWTYYDDWRDIVSLCEIINWSWKLATFRWKEIIAKYKMFGFVWIFYLLLNNFSNDELHIILKLRNLKLESIRVFFNYEGTANYTKSIFKRILNFFWILVEVFKTFNCLIGPTNSSNLVECPPHNCYKTNEKT